MASQIRKESSPFTLAVFLAFFAELLLEMLISDIPFTVQLLLCVLQPIPAAVMICISFKRWDFWKILALVSVFLLSFLCLLTGEQLLWALIAVFFASLCLCVFFFSRDGKTSTRFGQLFSDEAMITGLFLILSAQQYSFQSGGFFWISLLATGVLTAAGIFLLHAAGRELREAAAQEYLLIPLLVLLLFYGSLSHLNYLLDEQPPEAISTVIESKSTSSSRQGRSYYFRVTVNGEKESLEVSSRKYRAYEEGDELTVFRYDGAFGKPFFLPAP